MRERGIGEAVRARVLRLNPNPRDGEILRGWHPAPTAARFCLYNDVVSKRAFIRKHGRDAWDRLPRDAIHRDGRRAYVTRYAIEDRLWLRSAA